MIMGIGVIQKSIKFKSSSSYTISLFKLKKKKTILNINSIQILNLIFIFIRRLFYPKILYKFIFYLDLNMQNQNHGEVVDRSQQIYAWHVRSYNQYYCNTMSWYEYCLHQDGIPSSNNVMEPHRSSFWF